MKKFLVKLCVFIFTLSSIVLILNHAYFPVAMETQTYGTDNFRNMPGHIQICNFGSSHGLNGFNYDGVSDKFSCFNFSLHSQSLMYDYRILQHYINHINEGGIVFIVVSYFSFFGRPEGESKTFISLNNRYYKILPPSLIKNYDIITDCIINYLPVLTFDTKTAINVILGIKTTEAQEVKTAERFDDIKEVGEKRAAFHFNSIRSKENNRIIFSSKKTKALHDIITLCREKKLIPILVTTPYLTEYSGPVKRDSEFMNAFRSTLNEIIASEDVRYYDYSEDARFSHEYALFRDTDHLNKNGALKFTNILIGEVMHDLRR